MNLIRRAFGWLSVAALAASASVLPSCASMGGGMRYIASEPTPIVQDFSI